MHVYIYVFLVTVTFFLPWKENQSDLASSLQIWPWTQQFSVGASCHLIQLPENDISLFFYHTVLCAYVSNHYFFSPAKKLFLFIIVTLQSCFAVHTTQGDGYRCQCKYRGYENTDILMDTLIRYQYLYRVKCCI